MKKSLAITTTQKQSADAALIIACDQSFQTAGETLLLSAAVGGFIVNQLPWGEITPWLEDKCPNVCRRKISRWQSFSSGLTAANPALFDLLNRLVDQARDQIGHVSNSPPGGVGQLLFQLDGVDVKPLWKTIQATTNGKSMAAFIRDTKLLRAPAEDGGYRYDKSVLKTWLKAHHPDLLWDYKKEESILLDYESLPPKIQKQFRDFIAAERLKNVDPELEAKENREKCDATEISVADLLEKKYYADCTPAKLKTLQQLFADAAKELAHVIKTTQ